MSQNAMTEDFENIELFEKPALFSSFRIDRATVPDGWFCYDVRGSDHDPGRLATLEVKVGVNHAGTILSPEKIIFPKGRDHRYIGGNINFLGDSVTIAEFCERHQLPAPAIPAAMKKPHKKKRSDAYER